MKKEYSTSEVTITWEPHKFIHSKNCISGLSSVFDFEKRPCFNAQGASTETIVKQIDNCPSGALGYYFAEKKEKSTGDVESEKSIEVIPNGPLMVYGHLQVKLPMVKSKPK
ncbi:(4Fe-4S)-binding protein [Algoriphagus antarcticus]|uniref:Putative Fe-S cluster protein YjdI n=1 Tax=Algoriphagus antarcticus TaxID=238540 RepID=A0A3E0E985_9BACT|nr:(4Fe-4S)-binding protein [Algoriphagus antarcticus]REG94210.1 putative Fe-S cluster protein YjdI [Algoriphagus antarcticus]